MLIAFAHAMPKPKEISDEDSGNLPPGRITPKNGEDLVEIGMRINRRGVRFQINSSVSAKLVLKVLGALAAAFGLGWLATLLGGFK